jgi:TonB family protein
MLQTTSLLFNYRNNDHAWIVQLDPSASQLSVSEYHCRHPKSRGASIGDTLNEGTASANQQWIVFVSPESGQFNPLPASAESREEIERQVCGSLKDVEERRFSLLGAGESGGAKTGRGVYSCREEDLQPIHQWAKQYGITSYQIFPYAPSIHAALHPVMERDGLSLASILLGEKTSEIWITGPENVCVVRKVDAGLERLFEVIQEKLELKFVGSAAKLFYDGAYSFEDISAELVGSLEEKFAAGLKEVTAIAGVTPTHCLPLHVFPQNHWLEGALARMLSLKLLETDWIGRELSFDGSAEQVANSVSGKSLIGAALRTGEAGMASDLGVETAAWSPFLDTVTTPIPSAPQEKPETEKEEPEPTTEAAESFPASPPEKQPEPAAKPPAQTEPQKAPTATPEPSAVPAAGPEDADGQERKNKSPVLLIGIAAFAIVFLLIGAFLLGRSGKEDSGQADAQLAESEETQEPTDATPDPAEAEASAEDAASAPAAPAMGAEKTVEETAAADPEAGEPEPDPEPGVTQAQELAEKGPDPAEGQAAAEDAASVSAETAMTPERGPEEKAALDPMAGEPESEPEPEPEPQVGEVAFSSIPNGATVIINGEDRGVTPLLLSEEPVGTYQAKISKDGYSTESVEYAIETGRQTDAPEVTLRRLTLVEELEAKGLPVVGELTVMSEPEGVPFTLEGTSGEAEGFNLTDTTPADLDNLPYGAYRVTYEREGWDPVTETVRFAENKLEDTVSHEYDSTQLALRSEPSGAEVVEEGRVIGTTPLDLDDRPPGTIELELRSDGHIPESFTAELIAGESISATVTLYDVDRIFLPKELDKKPLLKTNTPPDQLNVPINRSIGEARVVVSCILGKDGVPTETEIYSTDDRRLNRHALNMVKEWRFEPAQYKEQPVLLRMLIPIDFSGD